MKPVVSIMHAWSCIVISVFAIVILSVLGALFNANHHSLMDSNDDPEDGTVVAGTAFAAVGVYGDRRDGMELSWTTANSGRLAKRDTEEENRGWEGGIGEHSELSPQQERGVSGVRHMGLLFFSFGIDICAFGRTGDVEDGKHLGSEVLRQREKAKIGSRNSGLELYE
ncbi:hypothetical protein V501_04732 [Pseudogymnoascus sp. VKM F-4519 (FW-2642)]|nr:hypothetical protein V501_04732 [Pseudogymnoascus sp. VKM F-4519 (FW-2642)]